MPIMHSMNLPNSYFGKLRISPTLQNLRASTLRIVCPFSVCGFLHGQRYIHHTERGSKVLLFVREFKSDRVIGGAEAYTF